MQRFAELADLFMQELDKHPHAPPDNMSSTMRGEASVLRLLGTRGTPMCAGELSAELGMRTSRISAVLNSLEKKGLIARRSDGQDKRRVMVHMTAEGERLHKRRTRDARAYFIAMLTALGEKDAEDFVRVCARLLDILPTLPPGSACKDAPPGEEKAPEPPR